MDHGQILFELGLNGAVHHGVVHLIIRLAHGGVGHQTEDAIALYHTVVDAGGGIVQQQGSVGALLLFEGHQHVVELVIGLRNVQAQLIQPILADHGAEGLGGLGLHAQLGHTGQPAAFGEGLGHGVGVFFHELADLRSQLLGEIGQMVDENLVGNRSLAAVGIQGGGVGNDVGEIVGGDHQVKLFGFGVGVYYGKLQIHAGTGCQLVPQRTVVADILGDFQYVGVDAHPHGHSDGIVGQGQINIAQGVGRPGGGSGIVCTGCFRCGCCFCRSLLRRRFVFGGRGFCCLRRL